jgi:hypothetical protein
MQILDDWKCSLTTALITVLVFLFLTNLFDVKGNLGEDIAKGEFFSGIELTLILSVFIGFLLNVMFFKGCSTKSHSNF